MSVKLVVAGRPPLELEDEYITLGSDPSCSVAFPDDSAVKAKHAVIHLVAGRWLIEARQAASVFIGSHEAKQVHWLTSGDVIQLTENGPSVAFHLTDPAAVAAVTTLPLPVAESLPPVVLKSNSEDAPLRLATPEPTSRPTSRNSDPIIPTAQSPGSAKPSSSTQIKATKPPSSAIIPAQKSQLSSTAGLEKPPSSKTIKTTSPSSSSSVPVPPSPKAGIKNPPSSKTIKATGTPSSADIPLVGSPPAALPGASKSPSSTTIRTTKPPSSTTIKTRVPLSSDTIPTVKPPSKLTRSNTNVDAASGKKSGIDTQALIRGSDDGEAEAKLPVLKRLSSWEIPIPGSELDDNLDELAEGSARKRGKRGDEADIRFIKTVVIRCAIALIGILILWQGYRELVKSMNGPRIDVPATGCVATEKPGPA